MLVGTLQAVVQFIGSEVQNCKPRLQLRAILKLSLAPQVVVRVPSVLAARGWLCNGDPRLLLGPPEGVEALQHIIGRLQRNFPKFQKLLLPVGAAQPCLPQCGTAALPPLAQVPDSGHAKPFVDHLRSEWPPTRRGNWLLSALLCMVIALVFF